jgi:HEAT repeat protein
MQSERPNPLQIILLVSQLLMERQFDELGELASKDERAFQQVVKMLRVTDGALCFSAAVALIKVGEPSVIPFLEALQDSKYPVRQAAALALGEVRDTRAVAPLIKALRDDHEHVRQAAANSLGKIGDSEAVEPLIAATRDDSEIVRRMAVNALGMIGDEQALPELERIAEEDIDQVAERAREVIRQIQAQVK